MTLPSFDLEFSKEADDVLRSAAEKTREEVRSRLAIFGFTAVEGVVADSFIDLGNGQVAHCQLFRVGRLVQVRTIRIGTK